MITENVEENRKKTFSTVSNRLSGYSSGSALTLRTPGVATKRPNGKFFIGISWVMPGTEPVPDHPARSTQEREIAMWLELRALS